MDVQAKLAEIRAALADARAMPMSSSCVVNRAELLRAVDDLAGMLPHAFGESDRVLADRDALVDDARSQARGIVAAAELERAALVSDSDVHRLSQVEADKLLHDARVETAALRRETDDYVDERLANFEFTLSRTLEAVQRGRQRLRDRSELDDNFGGRAGEEIVLPDTGP